MDTYVIKRNEELFSLTQEMVDKRLEQVNERLQPTFYASFQIGRRENGWTEECKVTSANAFIDILTKPGSLWGDVGFLIVSNNGAKFFQRNTFFKGLTLVNNPEGLY